MRREFEIGDIIVQIGDTQRWVIEFISAAITWVCKHPRRKDACGNDPREYMLSTADVVNDFVKVGRSWKVVKENEG